MKLRSDQVAGGIIIAAGALVFVLSGDLPTGRLSMPGAGMLPKLLCGLAVFFGLILVLQGGASARLSQLDWSDVRHAAPVFAITAAAVTLYTTLGFLVTMIGLLFALLRFERREFIPAIAYSVAVSFATYGLFVYVLRSPLEQGLLRF